MMTTLEEGKPPAAAAPTAEAPPNTSHDAKQEPPADGRAATETVEPGIAAGSADITRPTRIYIANVVMLAAVCVLLALYVALHLEPTLTRLWVMAAGAGVSLWSIFEMANAIFKWFGKGIKGLLGKRARRTLNARHAIPVLAVILFIELFALAVTQSIFLYRTDDKNDLVIVRLDPAVRPDLRLEGTHRVAGGRKYFQATTTVRAIQVQPEGRCAPELYTLHSWSAIKFSAPSSLPCRQYRVIRLVPVDSLWDVLPPVDGGVKPYYVQIRIGDNVYPRTPVPLHAQIIAVGDHADDVPHSLDDATKAEIKKQYAEARPGLVEPELTKAVNNFTSAPPLPIQVANLRKCDLFVNIYEDTEAKKPAGPPIKVIIENQMSATIPINWTVP